MPFIYPISTDVDLIPKMLPLHPVQNYTSLSHPQTQCPHHASENYKCLVHNLYTCTRIHFDAHKICALCNF